MSRAIWRMMAQNTSEDKEIADSDSHETTKPSESVGAIGDFLKPYFYSRDQLPKPSAEADGDDYFEFLGKRGWIYETALDETEWEERIEIEGILVGEVEKDFQTYPKGLPKCGRIECWAARLGLVNIVVALVLARGADDPESLNEGLQPTSMSKGRLALAIAAENNDFEMVDALKNIGVDDERFKSNPEPDLFSPHTGRLDWFESDTPVYELDPRHEFSLCPIEAAARLGHVDMVRGLIKLRKAKIMSSQEKMTKQASEMVMMYEIDEAMMKEKLSKMMTYEKRTWRRTFDWAVRMGRHEVVKLLIDRDYIVDLNKASNVRGLLNNADAEFYGWYQSPLALAVLSGHYEVVKCLCETTKGGLNAVAHNRKGITVLQMAYEKKLQVYRDSSSAPKPWGRIWNILMEIPEIEKEVQSLTEDRKLHVDGINSILVGTALIATVTFTGWLSPPLGYSSPPGTDGPFASVEGHPILESFWVFNSLSFFFSIATFMVGANVALPQRHDIYIELVVRSIQWKLRLAYYLVSAAVFFVMGAFASAGFAVLPPIPKYTVNMALTVGIGVTVVAVVVFSTFFGHTFTAVWQQVKRRMNFRCWQQSKHEMESSDDD